MRLFDHPELTDLALHAAVLRAATATHTSGACSPSRRLASTDRSSKQSQTDETHDLGAHPDIACLVARIEPDIVTWRRHLHAQPELSFKEFETSRFVAECLRSFGGIEVSHVSETGVMGRLRGTSTGPTIALRADIDALPIQEENTFALRLAGRRRDARVRARRTHGGPPRRRADPR